MSDLNEKIRLLRSDYSMSALSETSINVSPIEQFRIWINEAITTSTSESHAMILATVNKDNQPSTRVVLLREIRPDGFVFYTNYNSKKGKDIEFCPNASLHFFWQHLERQVKIEGVIEKVAATDSDSYFSSRPRESKIGAWASEQSVQIKDREILESRFIQLSEKYPDENIPRPNYWGGYILKPKCIEFWQGRPSRLHDRIQYILVNNDWKIERLAP